GPGFRAAETRPIRHHAIGLNAAMPVHPRPPIPGPVSLPVAHVLAEVVTTGLAVLAVENQVEGAMLAGIAVAESMPPRILEVGGLGVRTHPVVGIGGLAD